MAWRAYRKLPPDYLSGTFTQCTGEHLPVADSRYIHFWNLAYKEAINHHPDEMQVPAKQRLFINLAIRGERQALRPGSTGEWWCVSRGIADPIEKAVGLGQTFRFLPNSFNPERFNTKKRSSFRAAMRKHYGFSEDETILAFCSFGHFVRKGLLNAIEAVDKLRSSGRSIRLLVLGGNESTISDIRSRMASKRMNGEGVVFAGLVSATEEHLSAADALIFPSFFEAFSLVEIEAAALGIRLYLTPHPGSEMILREPENGRLLPWNLDRMVDVLADDFDSGMMQKPHQEIGEALTPDSYAQTLSNFYSQAIARKQSESIP
ncbi:glycosyltransferase [Luteolibacter pohnpeiensis]|uniref:Glycosyltransferase n=2 Tax=Luteolibacter pohnpeiensis TaxID=454153 RepID=A0A934VWG6_9BACT|nr:glycosyltransferase [Luteolibacter pohnpeiensis]